MFKETQYIFSSEEYGELCNNVDKIYHLITECPEGVINPKIRDFVLEVKDLVEDIKLIIEG